MVESIPKPREEKGLFEKLFGRPDKIGDDLPDKRSEKEPEKVIDSFNPEEKTYGINTGTA